ncbi:hypothetical protein Q7P35_001756 [Cladosporium inversicolor]
MAILPFTAAIAPILYKSPWTETACVYLENFDFVSRTQVANLDAPENRDMVQEALGGILVNVQVEIREISSEARDLCGVSTVGLTVDNTIFTTTRVVRACVAHLTRAIITAAKSAPQAFFKDASEVINRVVVVAHFFECLADLDNIGGYFNRQLKLKDKAPSPRIQHGDTSLFMEQDEDVLNGASHLLGEGDGSTTNNTAEVHGSEMTADGHPILAPSGHTLQSAAIHERKDDPPKEEEGEEGEESVRAVSQLALSTSQSLAPVPQKSRRLVSRATRDYEALRAKFELLSQSHENLRRTLTERRRTEPNICQGNCFIDLEEADHLNWEKGQAIDALKISIARLQS